MDLFLNLDTEYVTRSRRDSGSNTELRLNQGDNRRVRLFFTKNVTGPSLIEFVTIPTPYTLIQLAGRKASDLEEDELFNASDWTEETVTLDEGTDDELEVTCFTAMLSTRTDPIDDLLGTGETALQEVDIFWSVTITDGDEAEWTVVPRGTGKIFRDLRRGGTTPTNLPPDYPAANQIAPKTGVNFRFVNDSGYKLQIKNTTTNTWHTVNVTGASGSEVLELATGV